MGAPETNVKAVLYADAEEIDIKSTIKKQKKHIHHIIPDNKIIRRIINLYNGLNLIPEK